MLTNEKQTQCFSTHLTTFAGGFLILPAPINWNYAFANADVAKNKTIYLTMIVVAVLYIALVIYARRKDRKDVEKVRPCVLLTLHSCVCVQLGVTPLPDNHPMDKYFYQILVFTGFRKESGTSSKVREVKPCIASYSTLMSTRFNSFYPVTKPILTCALWPILIARSWSAVPSTRSSLRCLRMLIMHWCFRKYALYCSHRPLGILNYIRVWHDDSGRGSSASWFLKYIIVRDLQTLERDHFICQQWLAVDKAEGAVGSLKAQGHVSSTACSLSQIERFLPVASDVEKHQFRYVFAKKAYQNMSDGHLWFSIFSPTAVNHFTRVQRCTCCFVLFFTAMLLNILYYDQAAQTKNDKTGGLRVGPLFISREQV